MITRLPGTPPPAQPDDLPSFVAQLATALPAIHAVDPRDRVHGYSAYYEADRLTVPDSSPRPELWERAIEVFAGPGPDDDWCFIHRDYHPGNTLWAGGRMTGIVDWTAASVGPPALDIAHMRWNLARDIGLDAADEFAAHHRRIVGQTFEHQPYWDVMDAADALPELDPTELPAIEQYLAAALEQL